MQQPSARDRFEGALRRAQGEGPAVSAWRHYPGIEYDTEALAAAIATEVRTHDYDWVKVNPRGVYYSEIWGAEHDGDDYGGGQLPRLVRPAFGSLQDLRSVEPRPFSPVIAEQVELLRRLRGLLPDRPLLFTVFSPLSVLLQGFGLPNYVGVPPLGAETPAVTLEELWQAPEADLHVALDAITVTLAGLVRSLLDAGADGVFYAVTGTAHPALSQGREGFERFSTPYDLRVLDAAAGGVTVLHTCGPHSSPQWFTDWPVHAVHWDAFAEGNPGLGEVSDVVVGGGVSHHLFGGDHDEELTAQIGAAVAATDGRSFLLSPACTIHWAALNDSSLRLLGQARRSQG